MPMTSLCLNILGRALSIEQLSCKGLFGVNQNKASAELTGMVKIIGDPFTLLFVVVFTLLGQLSNKIKVVLLYKLLLSFYYYIYCR